MYDRFYKVDLKSMSVEDLLDEYSFWDKEWDDLWKDDDSRSGPVSDEEHRAIWDRRYDVIQEFKRRCEKEVD